MIRVSKRIKEVARCFFVVVFYVGGEFHLGERPEVPVGDLAKELLADRFHVKGAVMQVLNLRGGGFLPRRLDINHAEAFDGSADRLIGTDAHTSEVETFPLAFFLLELRVDEMPLLLIDDRKPRQGRAALGRL